MAGYGDGLGASGVLKATWVMLVLIVYLLLLVGIAVNGEIKGCISARSLSPCGHKPVFSLGRERHSVSAKHKLFFDSKRRVPSGPDPIHNRHVGDNGRSPGRA